MHSTSLATNFSPSKATENDLNKNEAVKGKTELGEIINLKMKDFINQKMEDNKELLGEDYYDNNPQEQSLLEVSRKGFCGECSTHALSILETQNITNFTKVNPSEGHFFLMNKNSNEIIEPTYKQMFFKQNFTIDEIKDRAKLLDKFPDVFHGSKHDFDQMIDDICEMTGSVKSELHANWKSV